MGSNGMQDCGGMLCRGLAFLFRSVGLGNPGVAVAHMDFDKENPLDGAPPMGDITNNNNKSTRGQGIWVESENFVLEELEEKKGVDEEISLEVL